MSQEADLINWLERFSQWTFAAAEPSANASRSAQDTIAGTELLGMAQTLVDGLLQGGYAPNQAAVAIAHGAYLTFAEMIRYYVQEDC